MPGSIESLGVGHARSTVLIDGGHEAPEAERLILRAPMFFAARRAERHVTSADFDAYGKGAREHFVRGSSITRAVVAAPQWAPDTVITETPTSSLGDVSGHRVPTEAAFVELLTPVVDRELKVQELRLRWEGEAAPGSGRSGRGRSGRS